LTETSEILTPEDVAELLRVRVSWVHEKVRARSRNPLPARRIGRYLRFKRSESCSGSTGQVSL